MSFLSSCFCCTAGAEDAQKGTHGGELKRKKHSGKKRHHHRHSHHKAGEGGKTKVAARSGDQCASGENHAGPAESAGGVSVAVAAAYASSMDVADGGGGGGVEGG